MDGNAFGDQPGAAKKAQRNNRRALKPASANAANTTNTAKAAVCMLPLHSRRADRSPAKQQGNTKRLERAMGIEPTS